ncbi:tetratricopeptide repeat-containing sensor histidine kinase [Cellulophaga lytica]|uniref:tetratricopeptide repeat-containing sensor histidine kinase n=1 Tax=Cellulophaga lytica TaxID=979 RepID=UPI000B5C9F83|nr:tetratricopeptide repeat protein [Cellulophaga lytica]SNQ42860.1 Two-component system - Sensor histidine kinase [Cellulophaga lytica]
MKYCFFVNRLVYSVLLLILFSCTNTENNQIDFDETLKITDSLSQFNYEKSINILDSLQSNLKGLTPQQNALILFKKGEIYYINDLFLEAINTHKKAKDLFINLNDNYNTTRSLITLSAANLRFNNLEKAQEFALEALKNASSLKDKRLLAKANNLLFQLHFTLKDYPKALEYIKKADNIFTNQNDTTSVIAIKSNIAGIYLKQKEYNKALLAYQEALELGKNIKSPQTIVKLLNNIGYTYIETEQYASAAKFLQAAINVNKNISVINGAPYKGLGFTYFLNNDFVTAKAYYKKAVEIFEQNKDTPQQIQILDKLITIAIRTNKPEEALAYQEKRDALQIKQHTKETERLLHFSTVKYKEKEKEAELLFLKQISAKNRLLYGSLVAALLLLLVLLGAYLYITKLKAANKASELEQSLLRMQMNPHFIFNTLAAIQNITLEKDPVKSSNYIAKFAKLIRQNFDYVRKEEISLEREINMISNYIETQQLRFDYAFKYILNVAENCDVKSLKVPPMLLQPFLENAIEYGLKEKKDGGILELNITKENTKICFVIKDNGVGRSHQSKTKKSKELHATDVFKERLKLRKKGEEKSFKIQDLYSENNEAIGTKITFKINIV